MEFRSINMIFGVAFLVDQNCIKCDLVSKWTTAGLKLSYFVNRVGGRRK